MTSNENIALWDAVSFTDPSFTHTSKVGGYLHTSIDGQYMVMKATEQWGPCGSGWGFEILEESYEKGAPIFQEIGGEWVKACYVTVHKAKILLWYMLDGQRCEVAHVGLTPHVYKSQYGITTDMESAKKSVTDGLKKALSMVGVCADVYLNRFSDEIYIEEQQRLAELDKADNKIEKQAEQEAEFKRWFSDHKALIETAANMGELEKIYVMMMRKLRIRGRDKDLGLDLTRAKDARKKELSNDGDVPQKTRSKNNNPATGKKNRRTAHQV